MEGKAPSSELRTAFAKFRAWLTAIYRSIRNLNVFLNKDIRGVFDRLIATDEEIQAAQEEGNITPIFTTAEEAGMSEQAFTLYEDTVREASEKAQIELQQKILKQYRREEERWWKDRRDEVKKEVLREFQDNKDYIALSILQRGTLPDGSQLPEGTEPIKISKKALLDTYDKELLKNLPKPFIYTNKEDGVHQDVAAELLSYSSGDEMIDTLSQLPNMKQAVETMTDARMKEQYGDKLLDGSLSEDARLAVTNDQRSKVVLAELKALRKLQRDAKPFVDAEKQKQKEGQDVVKSAIPSMDFVRNLAKNTIAQKKVRNITPYNHFLSARKASRKAFEALGKGNYQEAAAFKQQELLSMELYKEANRVKTEVDSIVNYMKKFGKTTTREKIAKAGIDYLDQIDSLLDRFDFAKGISLKRIDKRKSLVEWIESQEEQGLVPDIPEKLLNESYKTHYKDLSIEELVGLKDSIKHIETYSKLKNKLLRAAEKRAFDEIVDEAVSSIKANSKKTFKPSINPRRQEDTEQRAIKNFFSSHRKFSSLIRQMDGYEDGGVMWEILTKPMNDSADKEADMNAKATEKLNEIFSVYSSTEKGFSSPKYFKGMPSIQTGLFKKVFISEINDSMTKEEMLVVALNWGNEDSRQKVMDGRKWTQNQVENILDKLDAKDLKFVQSVIDYLNTFWEESKLLSERVNGVAPEKVEASQWSAKAGVVEGGYYRIKYENLGGLNTKAYKNIVNEKASEAMRGASIRATTRHGSRKERVKGVKQPIRLDFGVLFEHIAEVIHDQTHYEYLLDANKILRDEKIQSAINENHGDSVYREIVETVKDVAAGNIPSKSEYESLVNHFRIGTSIAAMGWNVMTALVQPLGITNSIVRIGPQWVAKGVRNWAKGGIQDSIKEVQKKSTMMRNRSRTQRREINEVRNQLKLRGKISEIQESFFYFIGKAQMVADMPTWLGAYEKAWVTDNNMTEDKAIALSDQAVLDSQGGGQIKDLSRIQRTGPLGKVFTAFYSFFNTLYNQMAETLDKHDIKTKSGVAHLIMDFFFLMSLSPILEMLIRDLVKGDDGDEEIGEKLIRAHLGYALNTVVGLRELGGVAQGYYQYKGPAGLQVFSETSRLWKQVEQGEMDEAFWKSLNRTSGILFHYPSGQVERTVQSVIEISKGRTSNPASLLVGPRR
jgi:hypothetical protein